MPFNFIFVPKSRNFYVKIPRFKNYCNCEKTIASTNDIATSFWYSNIA